MSLMPPPMKETCDPDRVVDAFLTLRKADRTLLIDNRVAVRPLARLRQELMWLLRDLTFLTLAEIGDRMGGRDLTTVKHGVELVADRLAVDDGYRREMLYQRQAIIDFCRRRKTTPDIALRAVKMVLADPQLTDAEARKAALQLSGEGQIDG